MAYYNSKYHLGINSKGYILSQKNGVRYYQKKRAPSFVNRVGSGDPAYRDSTFWSYFVQSNWRNGAKQLKFDDAGKFWKSSDVDTTQLEELSLSKSLVSAGQTSSGSKVNVIDSWRGDPATPIAFDASSSGTIGAGSATLTISHTITGSNTLLVVGIADQAAGGLTSVKYNNVSMTLVDSQVCAGDGGTINYLYYLLAPAAGTHDIVIVRTSTTSNLMGVGSSYTGVKQSAQPDASNKADPAGSNSSTTATITTVADNSWSILWAEAGGAMTAGAGCALRKHSSYASWDMFDSNAAQTPAGSQSMTFTYSATTTHTYVVASFAPAVTTTATSAVAYAGTSDGKVYSWDNTTTWTEVFDTRKLTWFETGTDSDKIVGDTGGTETAQSQGFQIAAATKCKAISVNLKKNAGTPGNITVRIETDNAGVPSGTLVDAAATTTITAFTTATYGWVTATFTTNFSLAATTTYHVVLKTAAAANDNNYAWAADSSSPGYSGGAMSASTDGGSTWSAVSGSDAYFRILGNTTSINCSLVTKVGGTKKMYFGTGDPDTGENGDARLYSFDGTTWTLVKTFTTSVESCILSLVEFSGDSIVRLGIGSQARIYQTSDFSTFTLDKDIDTPQNPGYPYSMAEYNNALYVGGGSPELIPSQHYSGFVFYFDTTQWRSLYPYEDTVIKSMEFYDSFLFFGTYFGFIVVFDTSSLNPLFNFKDQYNFTLQVFAMKRFEDKLYVATYPQDGSGETNVGVWVFDRRGFHLEHTVAGVTGFRCLGVVNGSLLVGTGDDGYVYKLSTTAYPTTGWYQSSYFDANLPSIPKLYNSVVIRHDPLVSGQSVNVWYKFKESDSWTQLTSGATNSVGDITQTLSFATGTTSNKISLKVVLNGGGTNTPRLTEVVLQYVLYPALKWQWNLRLKAKSSLVLADNTTETRSAPTIRSDLESLMNTQTLYTFVDVDGTSHNVLVNDIDQTSWVINPADVSEDEVALTLLEA